MTAPALVVDGLHVEIGRTPILRDVSLLLPAGCMAGLIGRNGAGKTTLLRSVMGLLPGTAKRLQSNGLDLTAVAAHARARHGIGYMPEDRRLVPALTVEENILLPAWANGIQNAAERLAWIYQLIPELMEHSQRRALQLSGGQQKLVALARALIPGRKLLLLDEPFEGVAPVLSRRLSEVIASLRGEGMAVILSESDDKHSSDLVDRIFRVERGIVHTEE
jgi:branched-chain amino acid transport system ATP-binding protein